ncbi:MAG: hypothetical protein ABIO02_02080, partial [Patescibacteria group bacterium]
MSSPNNVSIQNKLLTIVGKLSDIGSRGKISKQLANLLGADNFYVFIKDKELDILLPALGFPQTLPDSKLWNTFLENCVKYKTYKGKLLSSDALRCDAIGYAYKSEIAFILIGGSPKPQNIEHLNLLLPLISSVFRYELEVMQKETEINISKKSVVDSLGIARKLDKVRRDLQTALIEKQKEITFRIKAEEEQVLSRKKLEESEIKFRSMADNIPNLAWIA